MFFRLLVTGLIVAGLLSSCLFQPAVEKRLGDKLSSTAKQARSSVKSIIQDILTIAAVGDIMLGTSYLDSTALPYDSARNSFAAAANQLRSADVAMGNLEGTLAGNINPADFKLKQKSKPYLFRMPPAYRDVLKNAGFNLLSLANNHSNDFGYDGANSTMHNLDTAGIQYAGLRSHPVTLLTVRGTTYGFCAFSPNSQTVPLLDYQNAARIIKQLKQQCDIVIVSFHGGGEGIGFEHVPRAMETFIGEQRGDVYAFAHNAIDAGADMVFGNGPHVSRGLELYKNRFIAYSLGNFCTYKCVSVEGVCGLAPLLKIKVDRKGNFISGRLLAFRQTHAGGLVTDPEDRVINRMRELSLADFPESNLAISDDGHISIAPPAVLAAGG